MKEKHNKNTITQTIDVLFASAHSKLKDSDSQAVLENLRKLVLQVETDLYRPNPRFIDAFFFPNKDNIKKIVAYINMA